MPMLTRLGVASFWQSQGAHFLKSDPFFQEMALKTSLGEFLKYEVSYDLIWKNLIKYDCSDKKSLLLFYDKIFIIFLDQLADWYPVLVEEVEDIDESAGVTTLATSSLFLSNRFFFAHNLIIVEQRSLKNSSKNDIVKKRINVIFKQISNLWVNLSIDTQLLTDFESDDFNLEDLI